MNRILIIHLMLFCFSNAAQITFIVDMSDETIVAGDGNYPAVYVSGVKYKWSWRVGNDKQWRWDMGAYHSTWSIKLYLQI